MGVLVQGCLLGLAVLVGWGLLLAWVAALLPRFLPRWEAAPEPRALPPRELNSSAPSPRGLEEVLPPPGLRGPLAAAFRAPAPEDPMVVAAIALALTLHQEELARSQGIAPPPPREVPSSWALSGRWQAMQARLNFPKR
jgi:hypothetical protein